METANLSEQVEVFYGATSVNSALVYARLRNPPAGEKLTLEGQIRGPQCLYSTMLPATIRLADAGPGEHPLSKAMIPDPCSWSEELPALYDVHVEVRQGANIVGTIDRQIGIRQFGARGRFLYQNGKRWTVRAAQAEPPFDLLAWHDAPLALQTSSASDEVYDEASRGGVMLLVDVTDERALEQVVLRLARHAAVAVLVVDEKRTAEDIQQLKQLAPNILFASRVSGGDAAQLSTNRDALIVSAENLLQYASLGIPMIVERRVTTALPPIDLRLACDRLQADVASLGDFAGYLV